MKQIYEYGREKLNEKADSGGMFEESLGGLPKGMQSTSLPGFYKSPDTGNFDPRDCSNPRNATSPWCGYNPISTTPIGLSVSPTSTSCGNFVTIQATLGFIELPPVYLAYLNENCRQEYENLQQPGTIVTPPVTTPGQPNPPFPVDFDAGSTAKPFSDRCNYIVELCRNHSTHIDDYGSWERMGGLTRFDELLPNGERVTGWHTGRLPVIRSFSNNACYFNGGVLIDPEYEGIIDTRYWTYDYGSYGHSYNGTCLYYSDFYANTYNGWQNWSFPDCEKRLSTGEENPAWTDTKDYRRLRPEACFIQGSYNLRVGTSQAVLDFNTGKLGSTGAGGGLSPNLIMGQGSELKKYLSEGKFRSQGSAYYIRQWVEIDCNSSPSLNAPNPQLPGDDPMGCCDKPGQSNKEIIDLLKKIDKKLGDPGKKVTVWDEDSRKLGYQKKDYSPGDIVAFLSLLNERFNHTQECIGISDLPAKFPDSLNVPIPKNDIEKFWNWLKPGKERTIPSLVRQLDWLADQISAQQGQWQQYVEYEKTVKGKTVKEKVILPDVATTLRELFKMLTVTIQTQGMDTDILAMCIQNSTNNSVMLTELTARVRDIQLYLDHNTRETTVEYPALINPSQKAKNLQEYLSPSTLKVKVDEWQASVDRSLQEELDEMKRMLSILLANLGGEIK